MIIILFKILITIIATEAITELVVKSEFFEPLRKWLFESTSKILNFIHRIVDCGYCFSVWASILTTFMILQGEFGTVDFLVVILVVHRLSNMLHFIIDRLDTNKD